MNAAPAITLRTEDDRDQAALAGLPAEVERRKKALADRAAGRFPLIRLVASPRSSFTQAHPHVIRTLLTDGEGINITCTLVDTDATTTRHLNHYLAPAQS